MGNPYLKVYDISDGFIVSKEQYDRKVRAVRIPNDLMKIMIGGKWPKNNRDFNFDSVYAWKINRKRKILIPVDEMDEECPGPDLKIIQQQF
jgi:hypothetical protein